MNAVQLLGNLTKDPELRTTGQGIPVVSFTLAVNRKYKSRDGEKLTDFISCVAWRNTAEFVSRNLRKGSRIAITGGLESRTYDDKNGTRHYITEVNVDNVDFAGGKENGTSSPQDPERQSRVGYEDRGRYADQSWAPYEDRGGYGGQGRANTQSRYQQQREPDPYPEETGDVFLDDIDESFTPLEDAELPF